MIKVTSFYKFFPIPKPSLKEIKENLENQALNLNIRGLIIIGEEGINATFSGEPSQIDSYKKELNQMFQQAFVYKNSSCEEWNFKRLSVKIKKEIVTIGKTYMDLKTKNDHLSPKEWQEKLTPHSQVIDIRNDYEIDLGKFKFAKDLKMESFKEFPKKIDDPNINKEKETLIYCTGGIRCEKAIEIMKSKGFKNVYQLEGGILNYLNQYPCSQFDGECFVFDHRVSVDQSLNPSQIYSLCPHCGQPGKIPIECNHCGKEAIACSSCLKKETYYKTCSKNCAYHFKSNHKYKKKPSSTKQTNI